jgi:hypothetical protein
MLVLKGGGEAIARLPHGEHKETGPWQPILLILQLKVLNRAYPQECVFPAVELADAHHDNR